MALTVSGDAQQIQSAVKADASSLRQSFGEVNVCAPGQTAPAPCSSSLSLNFNVAANTTVGSIRVVTQGASGLDFTPGDGSSCAGAIAQGNSCQVNVNFAPLAPGLRLGAVNLFDGTGSLLASVPVYGVGRAPEIAFAPAMEISISTGSP